MEKPKSTIIAGISITNPDKLYFPEAKISKGDLALYYHEHSKLILKHILNRPLSLLRCPEGVGQECFFQKHFDAAPEAVGHVQIKEKTELADYVFIKDEASIISLVQYGALEFHTWGCPADNIEKPDRIVFDLDPGPHVPFAQVTECAKVIRAGLQELKLDSFVKTSGKKGLHVYIPLKSGSSWDEVKQFSLGFAKHLEKLAPDRFTSNIIKATRAEKILIDYLRNDRGATCVVPYSSRATSKAGVSTPLSWEELDEVASADQYTLLNIGKRLSQLKQNPWHNYFKVQQNIPKNLF